MVHILLDFKEMYDEVGGYSEKNQIELWEAFATYLERSVAWPVFGRLGNSLTHPRYRTPKLTMLYEHQIRKIYGLIPNNASPRYVSIESDFVGENTFFVFEVYLQCRNSSSHSTTTVSSSQ